MNRLSFQGCSSPLLCYWFSRWLESIETDVSIHPGLFAKRGWNSFSLFVVFFEFLSQSYSIVDVEKRVVMLLQPCQICWLCMATKGNDNNLQYCFLDDSQHAAFWSTYLQVPPWDPNSPPPYTNLSGFAVSMIVPDLLHVLNLGIGRDIAGSILQVLLKQNHVFIGGNLEEKFGAATASLRSYAKSNSLPLRMRKITKKRLNWGTDRYAELKTGSGYDNYVVCRWLQNVLEPHADKYPEFCTLLCALNGSMHVLYNANWFLTDTERFQVKTMGGLFIRMFLQLATEAVDSQRFLFRIRPKFHLMQHILFCRRKINCAKYSTWMDEDFLRKVARTMKLTPGVTTQERTLQRWLMAIPESLRKSMAN